MGNNKILQQMLQKRRVELKHSNVNFHKNLNGVEQFISRLSLNRQSISKSKKSTDSILEDVKTMFELFY